MWLGGVRQEADLVRRRCQWPGFVLTTTCSAVALAPFSLDANQFKSRQLSDSLANDQGSALLAL